MTSECRSNVDISTIYSDPSGPVNPVNSCIFVAVLYFPVFFVYVLYFPVFLVDCTIVVVDVFSLYFTVLCCAFSFTQTDASI